MKLIFCKSCGSTFSLSMDKKTCDCGRSWGSYVNNEKTVYGGNSAVPLDFSNRSFVNALHDQPKKKE